MDAPSITCGQTNTSWLRAIPLAAVVVCTAVSPTPASAQEEFPDSLWNYVQTPWVNFIFGLAVVMDVTGYSQDQASEDYFGNLNQGREGEIRGLRGLFTGQVRVLGRSYDYLFAAAYRGFDRGFESYEYVPKLEVALYNKIT